MRQSRTTDFFVTVLVLAALGLVASVELTVIHVRVHSDPTYSSFCAISTAINCDTVAASPYSVFLGVPVSVWGLLAYLAYGVLAITGLTCARRAREARPLFPATMMAMAAAGVALSGLLLGISLSRISSLCIICVFVYAINVLILLATVMLFPGPVRHAPRLLLADLRLLAAHPRRTQVGGGVAVALLLVLTIGYGHLYPQESWYDPEQFSSGLVELGDLRGHTAEGRPCLGATEPSLVVREYTDYQCPFCAKAHLAFRQALAPHLDRVQLVHHHFPLESKCNAAVPATLHPKACVLAKAAICADLAGRFWEYDALLFQHRDSMDRDTAVGLAAQLGIEAEGFARCIDSAKTHWTLQRDIEEGIALGLEATPTFFIGQVRITGTRPREEFDRLVHLALDEAP